ncbi:gastric triacylglycerol lipase-like isoform X2 [Crassostrea virginica]
MAAGLMLLSLFLSLGLVLRFVACGDPEVHMNATELILYNGYPVENHYTETKDGFIINMQRIPYGRASTKSLRGVVLLQHGLLGASVCFLMNQANGSLGFVLADAGYDVWLANSRGNPYSLRHKKYQPNQTEFWDWSWQEQAEYDLPAVISYICDVTKQKQIVYIGHSQGTLIANAQFSVDHVTAAKVRLFVALAPIARVSHVRGLLGFVAPRLTINTARTLLGQRAFDENSTFSQWYGGVFCSTLPTHYICNGLSSMIMGWDQRNLNLTRLPVYLAHKNEGTSAKNILHYFQEIKAGEFQKFDYGPGGNMNHYNQTTPPQYDPKSIKIPVAMYYGDSDFLADRTDVQFLLDNLPNIVHQKEFPSWNHVDFIYGINAPNLLYKDILELLQKHL